MMHKLARALLCSLLLVGAFASMGFAVEGTSPVVQLADVLLEGEYPIVVTEETLHQTDKWKVVERKQQVLIIFADPDPDDPAPDPQPDPDPDPDDPTPAPDYPDPVDSIEARITVAAESVSSSDRRAVVRRLAVTLEDSQRRLDITQEDGYPKTHEAGSQFVADVIDAVNTELPDTDEWGAMRDAIIGADAGDDIAGVRAVQLTRSFADDYERTYYVQFVANAVKALNSLFN